ncbi:MAG: hypothetical protein PHI86_02330 [Candidatus Omnitrophica bacterium]|nr:hypothetical protein [Candidatus Omnitrophota bacterium]HOX54064.1 hypothetical protein [Candidatus Omnitrophota bacterium]
MNRMVMIVYNEAIDLEVMEVMAKCPVKNYTKITGVYGSGETSGTHMGDDIWPGRNNILYVACKEAEAEKLVSCVKGLRTKLGKEGVKAFVWELKDVT